MIIKIVCGLNDTKRSLPSNNILPSTFVPRIGDTVVWGDLFWDVDRIVIDYDVDEIRVWVIDSVKFK